MKKRIEAIIFDYGGVISTEQDSHTVERIANLLYLDVNIFKNSYRKYRHPYDLNKISASQYWESILKYHKITIPKNLIGKLITLDVKGWVGINYDTLDYINKLNKSNVKTAIISNMTKETLKYMKEHFSWLTAFDSLIFSCELNISKPGDAIYKKCLKMLDLVANKCVFVDDSIENIEGANNIGLNTILFNDTEQLIREIENKYVFD